MKLLQAAWSAALTVNSCVTLFASKLLFASAAERPLFLREQPPISEYLKLVWAEISSLQDERSKAVNSGWLSGAWAGGWAGEGGVAHLFKLLR